MKHAIDRLVVRIHELDNPSVVGLDPTPSLLPEPVLEHAAAEYGRTAKAVAAAFFEFNKSIIDGIVGIVPAVKPQIAMYEAYGIDGINAYIETCKYAASAGLIVIGDIKRGDISSTAAAYAAHLEGADVFGSKEDVWAEDIITVNPYLGSDGILPFTEAAAKTGKGLFILVKTSNPSSAELQDRLIKNDCAKGSNIKVYEQVANYVEQWGAHLIGDSGYSSIGAVVGATHSSIGAELRQAHPQMFFLVPGYGAQGAGAEDLRGFFGKGGSGCIVNSSRGIIGAWKKALGNDHDNISAAKALELTGKAAADAAIKMRNDLRKVL